jgi:transcriptional regulator with XRE-family HTH domain
MDVRRVVGRNLKRARLERGLSQEALAHDAQIAPSFLSQIENGIRSPTITKLQDLATTLRIPIVEFFAESKATPGKGLPRGRRKR